jgi:hypothetical protein
MKPSLHATVAAEVVAIGPGLYEAVLHDRRSEILVAQGKGDKAQQASSMHAHKGLNIVQFIEGALTCAKTQDICRDSHMHASVDGFL